MARAKRSIRTLSTVLAAIAVLGVSLYAGIRFVTEKSVSPSASFQSQGDAFLRDGRLPEAVLSYRQALESGGDSPLLRQALSDAYQAQGRLRMAARYGPPQTQVAIDTGSLTADWAYAAIQATPTGALIQGQHLIAAYEDGTVVALSLDDGALLWKARLPAAATSAPVADQRAVWVGAQDGLLYSLDLLTGTILWTHPTGAPIFAAPTVDSGRVFCPSSDGNLYALDASSGKLLWKFATRGALHGSPAVRADRVVFGSNDARVYALDVASGAPVWQDGVLTGGAVESQPIIVENRIIVGSGDGRVYALALDSGGQFWRVSTPDAVYAAPVLDGNSVYVASSGKTLTAVDVLTGEKLWQTDLPASVRQPPVLANGLLYLVTDSDPGLYQVAAKTGALTLLGTTGDWISAGPWIAGARIYLAGKDGAILAYPLPR